MNQLISKKQRLKFGKHWLTVKLAFLWLVLTSSVTEKKIELLAAPHRHPRVSLKLVSDNRTAREEPGRAGLTCETAAQTSRNTAVRPGFSQASFQRTSPLPSAGTHSCLGWNHSVPRQPGTPTQAEPRKGSPACLLLKLLL